MYTTMYRTDNQQGPTVAQETILSICNNTQGKEPEKMLYV